MTVSLELNTYTEQETCTSRASELKKYLSVGRLGVTSKSEKENKGVYVPISELLEMGSGTMVVNILDFRLLESLKSALSRTFCAPQVIRRKLNFELLLRELSGIIPTSHNNTNFSKKQFYLISQHFSWFKN